MPSGVLVFMLGMLLPIGGAGWVGRRLLDRRLGVVLAAAGAGALAGGLPAALLFHAARHYQAGFAMLADLLGLLLGTFVGGAAIAIAASWPGGRHRPWRALGLTLAGAAIGTFVTLLVAGVGPRSEALSLSLGLSAGAVGALAALGYELGAGPS
jgi:hypothetical protein